MIDFKEIQEIPGWFYHVDQLTFKWILEYQSSVGLHGDLLEMGCYMGKSAAWIGNFIEDGQKFTVCDLFEDLVSHDSIVDAEKKSYKTLNQQQFEDNYHKVHPILPGIIRGMTSSLPEKLQPQSFRFVHIDASHMYEHVKTDAETAKTVLVNDGVAVFDDYRSRHTPGTALAVWEQVVTGGLRPICITESKFYGTWGDPGGYRDMLFRMLSKTNEFVSDDQDALPGFPILRIAAVKA